MILLRWEFGPTDDRKELAIRKICRRLPKTLNTQINNEHLAKAEKRAKFTYEKHFDMCHDAKRVTFEDVRPIEITESKIEQLIKTEAPIP